MLYARRTNLDCVFFRGWRFSRTVPGVLLQHPITKNHFSASHHTASALHVIVYRRPNKASFLPLQQLFINCFPKLTTSALVEIVEKGTAFGVLKNVNYFELVHEDWRYIVLFRHVDESNRVGGRRIPSTRVPTYSSLENKNFKIKWIRVSTTSIMNILAEWKDSTQCQFLFSITRNRG